MSKFFAALMPMLLCAQSVAAESPPNVIVILADDLGYGDLSCYGAKDLQSPHLDSLAQQGLKFTEFYANCPVCSPTRAALLTGRYQDLVGVPGVIRTHAENSWGKLTPTATLLPKLLKPRGYHSAIIGKWHLGLDAPDRPTDRGFDVFRGYLGDMMDDYYNHRRHGINYMREGTKEVDPEGHATDLFTQWACEYLTDRKEKREPFFLYLAYNAPHTPIQPPADWRQKVKAREAGISDRRAKLVALIEHMDDGIGKVMQCLQDIGQADNTLIIFTSDNGGQLSVGANNGPLRDGKQSVYEGGLKVPAIAVWPGKIAGNTTTDFQAMSMDICATVLDVAGADTPANLDGRSFLTTLGGKSQPALRKDWFFRRREGGTTYGGKTIDALRSGPWKLLQNSPFAPMELYHLERDPLEQQDLKTRERKVYQELTARLRKQIQRYGTVPWQAPE